MNILRNQKGVVLMVSYFIVVILILLSGAFFARTIQENRLTRRQNDSLKAFYNAEKGIAYAYFEACDTAWQWFTHDWDGETGQAVSNDLGSDDALRTQVGLDCYFIPPGEEDEGCYAAKDGSFILKTFSDPDNPLITVVRAKGISGDVQRVVEYRIARNSIYDFAWWTPYDLDLANVGDNVNGGRIHANGSISLPSSKQLFGVDSISTGIDQSIHYGSEHYDPPGALEFVVADADGAVHLDGKLPLPSLIPASEGTARSWVGAEEEPYGTEYPWQRETSPGSGNWVWRTGFGLSASEYAGNTLNGNYPAPPVDWRDEEFFFSGSSEERYIDSETGLNTYNTWLYPAQKDESGRLVFDENNDVILETPEEIPAEMEGEMWDWEKYNDYFDYPYDGAFGLGPQQEARFTVYNPEDPETPLYVENTRWKIDGGEVVMTDLSDPEGLTYWAMLQDSNYWEAIGCSAADAQSWATHINPEILDNTYGSEVTSGENIYSVDNTNSMQQASAWNDFLQNQGLEDTLLANERGIDMDAPRFATTYKQKSQSAGLYLGSTVVEESGEEHTLHYGSGTTVSYTIDNPCGTYGSYANPEDYWTCIEQNVDNIVVRLNTDAEGEALPEEQRVARKVKFINCFTRQNNVVMELDLAKMQTAGTFPANGIIYSEVPTRLSNSSQLPYSGSSNEATFNLICTENIYLKGDYNNPETDEDWMPSAIISKKQIYTLSDDFNDPGWSGYDDGVSDTLAYNPDAIPASVRYPNDPFVYVRRDGEGNLEEADPANDPLEEGFWTRGASFPNGSEDREFCDELSESIQEDWDDTFGDEEDDGTATYTVESDHPIIDGETWGSMPNKVTVESGTHYYNALFAGYYDGADFNRGRIQTGIPTGQELERWQYRNRAVKKTKELLGAFFQLDQDIDEAFVATEGVDFLDIPSVYYTPAFGGPVALWRAYLGYLDLPFITSSYDARFRNPLLALNKPIFFGGGESSWREISLSLF